MGLEMRVVLRTLCTSEMKGVTSLLHAILHAAQGSAPRVLGTLERGLREPVGTFSIMIVAQAHHTHGSHHPHHGPSPVRPLSAKIA